MPEYRRAYEDGAIYFLTVITYKRHPIFEDETTIGLLQRAFELAMTEYPFHIDAMVVLPDHIHCIWTLPDNDFDFSVRWKRIKAIFTRSYSGDTTIAISESMRRKKERGVWQRRFWEHMIRDQEDLNRHVDYIHYNPVKHGLVNSPGEWRHSSFNRFMEKGLYPADWGQTPIRELVAMELE